MEELAERHQIPERARLGRVLRDARAAFEFARAHIPTPPRADRERLAATLKRAVDLLDAPDMVDFIHLEHFTQSPRADWRDVDHAVSELRRLHRWAEQAAAVRAGPGPPRDEAGRAAIRVLHNFWCDELGRPGAVHDNRGARPSPALAFIEDCLQHIGVGVTTRFIEMLAERGELGPPRRAPR